MGPDIQQDVLVVFAEAFRRSAAGDDFTVEAIIAHPSLPGAAEPGAIAPDDLEAPRRN
jgi:hypothetical protein